MWGGGGGKHLGGGSPEPFPPGLGVEEVLVATGRRPVEAGFVARSQALSDLGLRGAEAEGGRGSQGLIEWGALGVQRQRGPGGGARWADT